MAPPRGTTGLPRQIRPARKDGGLEFPPGNHCRHGDSGLAALCVCAIPPRRWSSNALISLRPLDRMVSLY